MYPLTGILFVLAINSKHWQSVPILGKFPILAINSKHREIVPTECFHLPVVSRNAGAKPPNTPIQIYINSQRRFYTYGRKTQIQN